MKGGGIENFWHVKSFIGNYFHTKIIRGRRSELNGVGGYIEGVHQRARRRAACEGFGGQVRVYYS
jgi:hypothetical protein